MTRNVLLNLDTLTERPRIKIDGKSYEILSPDELPVLTTHRLAAGGRRLDELLKADTLTADDEAELQQVVATLSDTIMEPVPAGVRAKLSDAQRIAIIEAFSALLLSRKAGTAAALLGSLLPTMAKTTAAPPTGEKPSRGSRGSSAARRAGGSAKRRSRS